MRVLELFSGAGGSALGASGTLECELMCVDVDPLVLGVIEKNRAFFTGASCNVSTLRQDLISNPRLDVGTVDLIVAGPPCQPFSLGGSRQGFDDVRNGFESLFHVIGMHLPIGFVVENVPGIASAKFAPMLNAWLSAISGCPSSLCRHNRGELFAGGEKYFLHSKIVNLADYGLPQLRSRWCLVGIRSDYDGGAFRWPAASHSSAALRSALEEGSYWKEHGLHNPLKQEWMARIPPRGDRHLLRWRTCRDITRLLGEPERFNERCYDFGHFMRGAAKAYRGHSGSMIDLPSKTIKAGNHGVPGGENMLRFSNGSVRYMTLAESAILQGFPLGYEFYGGFNAIVRMIGNACPPVLISRVIKNVVTCITSNVPPDSVREVASSSDPEEAKMLDSIASVRARY